MPPKRDDTTLPSTGHRTFGTQATFRAKVTPAAIKRLSPPYSCTVSCYELYLPPPKICCWVDARKNCKGCQVDSRLPVQLRLLSAPSSPAQHHGRTLALPMPLRKHPTTWVPLSLGPAWSLWPGPILLFFVVFGFRSSSSLGVPSLWLGFTGFGSFGGAGACLCWWGLDPKWPVPSCLLTCKPFHRKKNIGPRVLSRPTASTLIPDPPKPKLLQRVMQLNCSSAGSLAASNRRMSIRSDITSKDQVSVAAGLHRHCPMPY